MPKFFFNIHDGVSVPDIEGVELPSLEAARNEAVSLVGEVLREDPSRFWNGDDWSIDVRDEHDQILFTLQFIATVAPAAKSLMP